MKWYKERKLKEEKALETLIEEMHELGWIKSPDTKERYAPHYIRFEKANKAIVIELLEFISFENVIIINGYVVIAISKYLQRVKL